MAPQQTGLGPYRKREPHRTCALGLCCRTARRQLRAGRTVLPRNCAGRSLDQGVPGCEGDSGPLCPITAAREDDTSPNYFMQTESSHARRLESLPELGEHLEGRFFSYASRTAGRSALEFSLRTGVRRKLTVSHAGRVTRAATRSWLRPGWDFITLPGLRGRVARNHPWFSGTGGVSGTSPPIADPGSWGLHSSSGSVCFKGCARLISSKDSLWVH